MVLPRMLCFGAIRGSECAMGWREINMNRRKPPLRLAAIAMAPGEDRRAAVLRKAAFMALETLRTQLPLELDEEAKQRLSPFLGGYLLGYARQVALKHGIARDDDAMRDLAAELELQIVALSGMGISGFPAAGKTADARCDAGRLVGRLEALCGTRHLVGEAFLCWHQEQKIADAASVFLTSCDNAADPMQSRAPTQSLRFSKEERAVILAGFVCFGAVSSGVLRQGAHCG